MPWLRATKSGVRLELLVVPRASRTEVVGPHDGRLKIRLAAPPVDGKANKALVVFLAKRLGVKRADLTLVSGDTGRRKSVAVEGVTVDQVATRLRG